MNVMVVRGGVGSAHTKTATKRRKKNYAREQFAMNVVRTRTQRTYIIIAATVVVRNENGKPFVILVICKMLNAMSTGMKIYFQTEFFC